MQRLFSMFPGGLPGAGLILLRAITSIPLMYAGLPSATSPAPGVVEVVTAGVATLLLIGLWTPLAGSLIAVLQLGRALSHPADPWAFVQVAVLGAALALLGPGECSVDARLYGRKHIHIPQR